VIERHIEKVILAVFVLLLLPAIYYWGISSPRKVTVVVDSRGREEAASPAEVDAKLLAAAKEIQAAVQGAGAEQKRKPIGYRSRLQRLQQQPFEVVALADLGQPGRPPAEGSGEDVNIKKPSLKDMLAVVPAPGKPEVMVDRELPRREDGQLADVITAHVAAVYPWRELIRAWNEKLTNTTILADVIVVASEAEVRQRRSDGTWSQPRPVQTTALPVVDSTGQVVLPPPLYDFDGRNQEQIRAAIEELAQNWQDEILQPPYWDIRWPTHVWGSWKIHLPSNPVSEAYAKLLSSGQVPGSAGPVRQRQPAGPGPGAPGRVPGKFEMGPAGPSLRGKYDLGPGGAGPARGKYGTVRGAPGRFPGKYAMGPGGAGPTRGKYGRGPAPRGKFDVGPGPIDRTARPVRRAKPIVAARLPADKSVSEPTETPVPPLADQLRDGQVLFWFHDTSLEPMKVYQYRVRLALVSPLVTYSVDVDNPDDAKPAIMRTPFSEWSNPISVAQDTEFFVTGHSTQQGIAYVTVFARQLGQWVKSKKFRVAEGEMIGKKAKAKLVNPEDGSVVRREVDFSTGAVVVGLDFNKTIRKKSGITVSTVEMYYLDADGKLKSRVRATDEKSARYEQLKQETERAKAAVGS